jgi:hypothetical protein
MNFSLVRARHPSVKKPTCFIHFPLNTHIETCPTSSQYIPFSLNTQQLLYTATLIRISIQFCFYPYKIISDHDFRIAGISMLGSCTSSQRLSDPFPLPVMINGERRASLLKPQSVCSSTSNCPGDAAEHCRHIQNVPRSTGNTRESDVT